MLLVSANDVWVRAWMIGVFTPDAQVVEMGAMALRIVALAEPLFGLSIVGPASSEAPETLPAPVWIGLFCMLAVRVPLAYLFVHGLGWGLAGAWIAMDIDLALRGPFDRGTFFLRPMEIPPRKSPRKAPRRFIKEPILCRTREGKKPKTVLPSRVSSLSQCSAQFYNRQIDLPIPTRDLVSSKIRNADRRRWSHLSS